ncbi:MAG: helix-turn-helix domain-containing protein [Muribaculaceae bacterium]|nr:helix-turn-helix domain-containing protein [Muribaculaceae bacterium]
MEDEVDEVWLTLPLPSGFPIFIASHGTVNPTEDPVNSIDGTVNGTVNGSKMSFTSTQNAILSVLANHPEITADAVCTKLNISRRTVLRAYKNLQETGMLIRVGSDKTGRWIVNINNNKN